MRSAFAFLLVFKIFVLLSNGEPQFYYGDYRQPYFQPSYFRQQPVQAEVGSLMRENPQARLFFSTLTLTLSTITTTKVTTSTTVCTTTTAAVVACVAAGGRRRRNELFYSENPFVEDEEAVFLPVSKEVSDLLAHQNDSPSEGTSKALPVVPITLDSTFGSYTRFGNARFLLAVDTSTVVISSTSLLTVSLTAICSSTTNFSVCTGSG